MEGVVWKVGRCYGGQTRSNDAMEDDEAARGDSRYSLRSGSRDFALAKCGYVDLRQQSGGGGRVLFFLVNPRRYLGRSKRSWQGSSLSLVLDFHLLGLAMSTEVPCS